MFHPDCKKEAEYINLASKKCDILAVGGVDEVTTALVKGVEELEARLFVHAAHAFICPLITNAHCSEHEGRDIDTSERRKNAV